MRRYDPLRDPPEEVLGEVGARLKVLDHTLVSMLAKRERLAEEVVFAKVRQGDGSPLGSPIYNSQREQERLEGIRAIAHEYGVDGDFAAAMLYTLIGESCKTQMKLLQSGQVSQYGDLTPAALKRNLLELTELVASDYDASFSKGYPATQMHVDFEAEVIATEIGRLDATDRALDLGCATGRIGRQLAACFGHVDCVDISDAMVEQARMIAGLEVIENQTFHVGDIEGEEVWSGLSPSSYDLVVMGLGTAGDIRETRTLIEQIQRVLKPGGRFVLSFYNQDGLLYRYPFIPWSSSLAGVIDPHRNCLEVRVHDRTFPIFAQALTEEAVSDLLSARMHLDVALTHPTTAAVMPREMMLLSPEIFEQIRDIDRERAGNGASDGAYLVATGHKS